MIYFSDEKEDIIVEFVNMKGYKGRLQFQVYKFDNFRIG